MNTTVGRETASSGPLLRLPTEIRNLIYQLVMGFEKPIERKKSTCVLFPDRGSAIGKKNRAWDEQRQHVDTATSLSLALTCRQIYRETTGYYYTLNAFAFNLLDFPDFSRSIRSTNLSRIAVVHCTVPAKGPLSEIVYLFRMMGLKRLHLELERPMPGDVLESPWAVGKWWKLSKSLEEVRMTFATRAGLVYHWTILNGQLIRRVYYELGTGPQSA
ncbi:MAG: hypothetical protein FRX48_05282 [Lasallia pustulata]|uniref:DUF7730 domain-containing protein n=1 Tax=Lasallia pustulata TaxID=136370 RepID=A0A5M8PN60_9LECA|nr:MAG: hypothetical protein FRX48_05282 [Lasallia pustulata]